MADYDTVIIGGGHNGLVCASYLAARGQKVLIVEASDTLGGLAAMREFHPGFRASVAHTADHVPRRIVNDLDLMHHGLAVASEPPVRVGLDRNGNHVILKKGVLAGVPQEDQASYAEFTALMSRFAEMLSPFWLRTVPPIGHNSFSEVLSYALLGLKVRMLGKKDMREFLRILTLPMQDLMDEYFEHPLLKAMLCWNGLVGSKQAPRSPNNSVMQLLYRMNCGPVTGVESISSLINALYEVTQARGVEIRLSAPVSRINVDAAHLAATGVSLESGEIITARNIVSSADPKTTFLELLGVDFLEIEFTNRIRRLRTNGLVAKLHLALNGMPAFTGLDTPQGKLYITPDMQTIERSFDDAKYGNDPRVPVMELTLPSLRDPSHAPHGQHLLSAQVMYVPYRPAAREDEATRKSLMNAIIDAIAVYAPGIREQIVGSELLTPGDLERQFHVTGGHWHHADFALDQLLMMRPTYGAAQYRTPVNGLYLCGAGTHPAGDVTGAPGHNAAGEISQ